MPFNKSKVSSAEVFNVQRKKRLTKGRSGQSVGGTDQPHDQVKPADTDVPQDNPDTQHHDHSAAKEPEAASTDQNEAPGADLKTDAPEAAPRPVDPPRPARHPDQPAKTAPDNADADDQLRLQVKLPYPASGASATFDQLVDVQGEKGAFRLVLTKALELYAASVADGTFADAPTSYPESKETARTTRSFPKAAYTVLENRLNRSGLLSDRAVGIAIARRALAAFIASDKDAI